MTINQRGKKKGWGRWPLDQKIRKRSRKTDGRGRDTRADEKRTGVKR